MFSGSSRFCWLSVCCSAFRAWMRGRTGRTDGWGRRNSPRRRSRATEGGARPVWSFFFVYSLLACDLWRSWREYVQPAAGLVAEQRQDADCRVQRMYHPPSHVLPCSGCCSRLPYARWRAILSIVPPLRRCGRCRWQTSSSAEPIAADAAPTTRRSASRAGTEARADGRPGAPRSAGGTRRRESPAGGTGASVRLNNRRLLLLASQPASQPTNRATEPAVPICGHHWLD